MNIGMNFIKFFNNRYNVRITQIFIRINTYSQILGQRIEFNFEIISNNIVINELPNDYSIDIMRRYGIRYNQSIDF